MRVRGLQIALAVGLSGLLCVLVASLIGERRLKGGGDRAFVQTASGPAVAPHTPVALDPGPSSQPEAEPTIISEPGPDPDRERPGPPSRLPARLVHLVKQQNLAKVIEKYAGHYGVDEDLVWAVIRQESGFNAQAVSPKGAMGLMQLMPGTAALMGVSDPFDVEQNIAGGVKYLDRCLSQFNQDVGLALAAYNAGPDNVVKYQGCPPFAETRHYVATILRAYAGESIRENLNLISDSPVMDEGVAGLAACQGLAWRISGPRWRIAAPRPRLAPPHWKVTLRPF